ncbi:MAG: tyrosine-type recombinase/integrase [Lachnospiraceae bacterium]|nr:tyrosine-type recombinase/integrase [Lachnospiraceae bacterium]
MTKAELQYVTKEAVQRGCLEIRNKGKSRKIPIPLKLKVALEKYMKEQGIQKGIIFLTSGGKIVDRSNIWRGMKKLCEKASIDEEKVFPHNLRHLFAQCFYAVEKDIAKLADMLGHSRIETTRIYIMTTGVEHKRQLEQMEMVLGWRTGTT